MPKSSAQNKVYKSESNATDQQQQNRSELQKLFEQTPLGSEDLLFNLGLYTRGSLLAKYLVMNDLYQRIKDIPGHILEFGVWYGLNMVLLENLRAIYEPFNKQRIIAGFDTFTGYKNFSDKDKKSKSFEKGAYSTPKNYEKYLEKLLQAHEGSNILGNVKGNHRLIKGDIQKTAPKYFKDYPETIVALAYMDLGNYNPTKTALEAIKPHLVPGSVVLMDQLTWEDAPGEAVAFKEVFSNLDYTIEKSIYYPSKSIVTVK